MLDDSVQRATDSVQGFSICDCRLTILIADYPASPKGYAEASRRRKKFLALTRDTVWVELGGSSKIKNKKRLLFVVL
jgi:hypothetical protein